MPLEPLNFTNTDQYLSILPELVLLGVALLLLVVEMVSPRARALAGTLSIAGVLVAMGAMLGPWTQAKVLPGDRIPFLLGHGTQTGALETQVGFFGNVALDGFGLIFRALILAGTLLVLLMAYRYAERFRNPCEFFALLIFATAASMLLCVASDLVMVYLTIEFLSIASYVLVGYLKFQPRSNEAAIKYFLYGAITAAVMLYGMTFLYGATGTTNIYETATRVGLDGRQMHLSGQIQSLMQDPGTANGARMMLVMAAGLMLVGFGFKIATVPFHQWVPDVYDAAPIPVMAWLSIVSKAGGLAVMIRVFVAVLPVEIWSPLIQVLAAATMTVGNLTALRQTNIKRMLAYSSIAHAGYILMGFAAFATADESSPWITYSIPIYLATYVFMNLGALAVVTAFYETNRSHQIADYAGLAARSPALAWSMVFFLLSLAGLPPTAGFFGKVGLFFAAIETGLTWLAIVAFVNSVISVYYYFGVVRAMFFDRPRETTVAVRTDPRVSLALAISVLGTFALFLFAQPFLRILGVMQP